MDRTGRRVVAVAIVVASCVLGACDTRSGTFSVGTVAPTPTLTASSVATHLSPLPLPLMTALTFGCPLQPPFTTAFDLIIEGDRAFDFFLSQVQFDFFDRSGVAGVPLILLRPDLTARFGPAVIPAGTSRTFPLQPQFGCGLSTPGSLTLRVSLLDQQGHSRAFSMSAPIR